MFGNKLKTKKRNKILDFFFVFKNSLQFWERFIENINSCQIIRFIDPSENKKQEMTRTELSIFI